MKQKKREWMKSIINTNINNMHWFKLYSVKRMKLAYNIEIF